MQFKIKTTYSYTFILLLMFCGLVFGQNTNPVVSNVDFTISGTTVAVTYDLSDAEQDSVSISMEVSNDGGVTYGYNYGTATGDIGANVTTGTNKTITWQYNGNNTDVFRIKIIADDETLDGNPCLGTPTVTYGGQIYNTVQIGDQCWFKENLNIGTMIESNTGGYLQTDNGVIEKYCYDNDENNCTKYGGLYEWTEAMQYVTTEGTQGICPSGWHIPTRAEFKALESYVNDKAAKLVDISESSNAAAFTPTNTSGFSALFTGARHNSDGRFYDLGLRIHVWSSTENDNNNAYRMSLRYNYSDGTMYHYSKNNGWSVRCLKD